MKTFYVDFSGYSKVEANSIEEAKELFYEQFDSDYYVEIDNVEEAEEKN